MEEKPNQAQKPTIEPPQEVPFDPSPHAGAKGSGMMPMIGIILAIVAILAAYFFSSSKVSMADETKNFQGVTQTITNIQNDLKATQSNLTTAMNNQSKYDTQFANLGKDISGIQSTLSGIKASVDNAVTTAGANKDTVASLQTQLASVQASLKTVNDTLTALKTQQDTEKADISTLKTQVAALATTPATTTPTTPVTGTVTANVVGNVFTGSTGMTFASIAAGGTASQSFTFQVNNGTGKTLKSLQLALGVESVDTSGTPLNYPSFVTMSIASTNLSFIWTTQSTGLNYLAGWITNTASTGFLGQINSFSQVAGITTYTVTLTVTNTNAGGGAATAQLNLLPFIQVVNYTN